MLLEIVTENTEECEWCQTMCTAKPVFVCDYTGVCPLNSINVLWWWHCTAEGQFLIPVAHCSETPESALVSQQDWGLEGEFLLQRAAQKVLAASHLSKLLCLSVIETLRENISLCCQSASLWQEKLDVWAGSLELHRSVRLQCLCGLGMPSWWLAGLGVCSTECVTSRNDEWHCWLCIAITLTGQNWEMLGCGGGIPEGKVALICLNLREGAFP